MKKYFLQLFLTLSSLLFMSISLGMDDDPEVAAAAQAVGALAIQDDGGEERLQFPLPLFSVPGTRGTNIKVFLKKLISEEQESICGSQYRFTLYDVAQRMVAAAQRGVRATLILDPEYGVELCDALRLMVENGVQCYAYQRADTQAERYTNVHHKLVFGRNVGGRSLVWTGSYNPTGKSNESNWENVVVFDDRAVVEGFLESFQVLRRRARRLQIADIPAAHPNKTDFVRSLNCIPGTERIAARYRKAED